LYVAKLIILRGDADEREVDLGERTVRIGRADQNDIVLADPAKSVSRAHAELRFEQGKYVIVDLNSQNGLWADGRRVPQATLEPGVPVVLGSYRLALKQELPPAPVPTDGTVVLSPVRPDPPTAATMIAPLPTVAPPPPLAPTPNPTLRPAQPPPAVATLPAPGKSAAASPAPARPAATPGTPPKPAAQVRPASRHISKGALVAGFGVLLVTVLAAAAFLTPLGSQLAVWTGRTGTEPPAAAPAPAPADAGVVDTQPAAPGAQPPVVPPPPEQAVAVPADMQPAATPPRAARAQVETPPVPGRAPDATAGGRRRGTATAAGGSPGSKPKPPNPAQKLEEARAAMNAGDYLAAIAGFEAILAVDPQNQNAADLLGVARGGARNASRSAVDTGSKAEASGDYAGAARHYERALELDPESTAAHDAMRRLKARMQSDGEDAFKRARQYDALGRVQEAISMYEKAVQLLPADHANVKVARDRLAALKGGL
jgi:hypothetical protein